MCFKTVTVLTFAVPSRDMVAQVTRVRRKGPPMRRLSEDARPLSNAEMDMHRKLLQTHTSVSSSVSAHSSHPINSAHRPRKTLESQLLRSLQQRNMPYAHPETGGASRILPTSSFRTATRGVPMTPTIDSTTISLTPSHISNNMADDLPQSSLLNLPSHTRRYYRRSMSQPLNLIAPVVSRGSPHSQAARERRLMIQRLSNLVTHTNSNQSGDSGSNLPNT